MDIVLSLFGIAKGMIDKDPKSINTGAAITKGLGLDPDKNNPITPNIDNLKKLYKDVAGWRRDMYKELGLKAGYENTGYTPMGKDVDKYNTLRTLEGNEQHLYMDSDKLKYLEWFDVKEQKYLPQNVPQNEFNKGMLDKFELYREDLVHIRDILSAQKTMWNDEVKADYESLNKQIEFADKIGEAWKEGKTPIVDQSNPKNVDWFATLFGPDNKVKGADYLYDHYVKPVLPPAPDIDWLLYAVIAGGVVVAIVILK